MIKRLPALISSYKATLAYIVSIVLVNGMFTYLPFWQLFGQQFSPGDVAVGVVYVLRDFTQREIKHRVMYAMLVGGLISFSLTSKTIAYASVIAFFVGESIDWAIYTFTKKPLSQRLLWSSCISAPPDSFIFLYLIGRVNWIEFTAITLAKFVGVFAIWAFWKYKRHQAIGGQLHSDVTSEVECGPSLSRG